MSHEIFAPIDIVISTEGVNWHGLARVEPEITDELVRILCPKIIQSAVVCQIDDETVPVPNYQILVADYRACRPDLVAEGLALVPLHVPKDSYQPISNWEIWEALKKGLSECGARVTDVGTLSSGQTFYVSASLPDMTEFNVNGDAFRAHFNIIGNHTGLYAVNAYDSMTRIVCMNTLRYSLQTKGNTCFRVPHTKNALLCMDALGDAIADTISGRKAFVVAMRELKAIEMGISLAREITAGFFVKDTQSEETGLATRSLNAVESIVTAFVRGKGNNGESAYDLLNGATEHWTSGDGVGKTKTDLAGRIARSEFGRAATHKDAFFSMLQSEESRNEMAVLGRNALQMAS